MPATVDAITDATAVEKSAVTFDYEAMLAALDALLAEMREERRPAEAPGSFAFSRASSWSPVRALIAPAPARR